MAEELRVLLVDDEEELVTTLVERLGYRGITAEYALDGIEALAKMRQTRFHVVVLDLKLPGMEGTEVIRQIAGQHPGIPVIMITGHGSPLESEQSRPPGAWDYLIKPVQLDVLIQRIREAAGHQ